jgi:hypothetical protein
MIFQRGWPRHEIVAGVAVASLSRTKPDHTLERTFTAGNQQRPALPGGTQVDRRRVAGGRRHP